MKNIYRRHLQALKGALKMAKLCKIFAILICIIFMLVSSIVYAGVTESVSVFGDESIITNICDNPSISADGRFVAYESQEYDLSIGKINKTKYIYVHDRLAKVNTLVSVSSNGINANKDCSSASISADGRFIAFNSDADNLVPNDTNNHNDVFVHDMQTAETKLVSVSSKGVQADYTGKTNDFYDFIPSISGNGRYIAFRSVASNLVIDDTNDEPDVFVHDMQTGETKLVSVSSDGIQGNSYGYKLSISSNGRFVAFSSDANNLVAGDTNNITDIFVYDMQTATTQRVSISSEGMQANNYCLDPFISADGRYITFTSYADNLVSSDTNGYADIFVHDMQTGETQRVSLSSSGLQGRDDSDDSSISADGNIVAFHSSANNLVSNDRNQVADVFIYNRLTGETTLVSKSSSGVQSYAGGSTPYISEDGNFVAYTSTADQLVPEDSNSTPDIFVYEIDTPVQYVALNKSKVSLNIGSSETLQSTLFPNDATNKGVIWSSSNSDVAIVNNTGKVAAIGNGKCTIQITSLDGAKAATCEVTVVTPGPGVILNKSSLILNIGDSEVLDAMVYPIDSINKVVTWSSENTSVATVDDNGKVTALGIGTCKIIVSTLDGSRTASCQVSVCQSGGVTQRVSVSSEGKEAFSGGGAWRGDNFTQTISADGRFIVFTSKSKDLVPNDTDDFEDDFENVFVYDRQTYQTERITMDQYGQLSSFSVKTPSISADGRYIAFSLEGSSFEFGSLTGCYVYDRLTDETERVSVSSDGIDANMWSYAASISADGNVVAFHSRADNLVPDDTNANLNSFHGEDLFIHNRLTGLTKRVNVSSDG